MIGTVFEGRLTGWLSPFEPLFTRPTWRRVLVLTKQQSGLRVGRIGTR